jgi:acyl CoA:acetate/3-ketoacid CoA transferase beta subunit
VTAPSAVKLLATDLGLFEITPDGFILKEYAPGWTLEEIQAETEAKLTLANNAKEFRFR